MRLFHLFEERFYIIHTQFSTGSRFCDLMKFAFIDADIAQALRQIEPFYQVAHRISGAPGGCNVVGSLVDDVEFVRDACQG